MDSKKQRLGISTDQIKMVLTLSKLMLTTRATDRNLSSMSPKMKIRTESIILLVKREVAEAMVVMTSKMNLTKTN